MANSELLGNEYHLDEEIKNHLSKIVRAFKGDKKTEGYTRSKKLIENPVLTYEQLKRVKNFFDTYEGKPNETPYILNGGSKMKNWVNQMLSGERQNVKGKKTSMMNIGMDNQFIDTHEKKGIGTNTIKLNNDNLKVNENIVEMNNLITEIFNNKKIWHTDNK